MNRSAPTAARTIARLVGWVVAGLILTVGAYALTAAVTLTVFIVADPVASGTEYAAMVAPVCWLAGLVAAAGGAAIGAISTHPERRAAVAGLAAGMTLVLGVAAGLWLGWSGASW